MAAMASTAVLLPNFLQKHIKMAIPSSSSSTKTLSKCCSSLQILKPNDSLFRFALKFGHSESLARRGRLAAVAEDTSATTIDPSSEAARRLYVGNIPRTVNNDELRTIFEEHGAVEKVEVMYDKYSGRSRRFAFVTMKTVEDVDAAIEKLNDSQIGGREIKVNVTEKPLQTVDYSLVQAEESQFIDSPHKVYVGNLAKTVTSESLKSFFAEKGNVVSAKISRVPGTSKSSGFGFVTFSSDEDVEAAVSSFNNALLAGQKIRVNRT